MTNFVNHPYYLTLDTMIVVRITATNAYGTSLPSTPNTSGASVRWVPRKPPTPITSGSSTNQVKIEIIYAELTGLDTGLDTITSYFITWD